MYCTNCDGDCCLPYSILSAVFGLVVGLVLGIVGF